MRPFQFSSCAAVVCAGTGGAGAFLLLSSPLLVASQRGYFVRHRKTPNADCMMFHVTNFYFRIGSQERLVAYLQEQAKKNGGAEGDEDGDDWDGPGPINNAAKRFEQDELRREENRRRTRELRNRNLRAYISRAAQETMMQQQEDEAARARRQRKGDGGASDGDAAGAAAAATEEGEERDTVSAACENVPDFAPTSHLSGRGAGGGVVSGATRPQRPAAEEDGKEVFQPDIDDAAAKAAGISVIASTFSFAAEEKHLSPLAKRVYESDAGVHVAEVVVGKDFVTVRRKSDEELHEEWEAEQERRRQARARGEDVDKKPAPQHEAVVTSLGTLTDMVPERKAAKAANDSAAASQDDAATAAATAATSSEVDSDASAPEKTRAKLAAMYRESEENKRAATEEKLRLARERDPSAAGSKTGTLVAPDEDAEDTSKPKKARDWFDLLFDLSAAVTDHLYFNEVAVDLGAQHPHADTEPQPGDSEVVGAIKELIAQHLRPLLQADGGDIRYCGFTDGNNGSNGGGVLQIEMLGSCKTCKKSDTTLKDLIERTVQHFVPEVREVQEIQKQKRRLLQQQQSEAGSP